LHRAQPEPPVEVRLARHVRAVDAHDDVARTEARRARGSDGGYARDHHAAAVTLARVKPEPRPGTAALDAALGDQLVLPGNELLDRDGEVDEGRFAEPERSNADDGAGRIHEGRAAERGIIGRHEACPAE